MSPAKMTEPIDMLFGVWSRAAGLRNNARNINCISRSFYFKASELVREFFF